MNKELLISIKPEHLVSILNGKKTLELRKTVPKDYKGWVNIYCTKSGYNLIKVKNKFVLEKGNKLNYDLNGKVVARFWFDEYDTLTYFLDTPYYVANNGELGWKVDSKYIKLLCLDYQDVLDYGFKKKPIPHQAKLYAWHIDKLKIFDKPKELSEFSVEKPPQIYNFAYVKE